MIDLTTVPLSDRIIHRWLWLALPDDCAQEVALMDATYPALSPDARRRLISMRLRRLRHDVWDQIITRTPQADPGTRPSKLAVATGYRRSASGHRAAREKLDPARRSEIARKAAAARWRRNEDTHGT